MKKKFTVVRVLSSKQNISEVLSVLLENNFISAAGEAAGAADLQFKRIEGENPFEHPLAQLKSVSEYAGWESPEHHEAAELSDDFSEYANRVYKKYKRFKKDKQLLLEQREDCIEGKNRIKLFGELPVDLQSLNECEFVKTRFGHIPKNCLLKLKSIYNDEPFTEFFESYESETDVWGIYLVPRNDAGRIDSIFASLLFEPVNIPSAAGSAAEIERQIDASIEIIDIQLKKTKAAEDYFFKMEKPKCVEMLSGLKSEYDKREFLTSALVNEDSYIIFGSLPTGITDSVCSKLEKTEGAFITKLNTVKLKVS